MLGDVVGYNFHKMNEKDNEVYSLDYAIVLDYNVDEDTIKILPFTNKYTKPCTEAFCIGEIDGFVEIQNEGYVQNDQYVHFEKVINVKESELSPVALQDVCGNISRNESGAHMIAHLNDDQLEKVLRKYKIYELGEENSLMNLLLKADARFLLDDGNIEELRKVFDKGMDKYVEYSFDDKKVIVFHVDNNRYSAVMNISDNECINKRNDMLRSMLLN